MAATVSLHPTLWRTCRVLANRRRLAIFRCLIDQPAKTVSAVAKEVGITLPVASQGLRSLEARGLLEVRRKGRWVTYSRRSKPEGSGGQLIQPLVQIFQKAPSPASFIFEVATAFTHPRRITLFRLLKRSPLTFDELAQEVPMSKMSLSRHLEKLEKRGFIRFQFGGRYAVPALSDPLRKALAKLAME